ncbi:MAG: cbb3-type cytochrome oxidase assembly protein CcoS [Gammaproteobacteria bacterium]|nr:cbb3-type cytochrome oxidase assembly protein CcoS [Gammaproteobacteria bacterium]
MEVVYLLVLLALVISLIIVGIFLWSVQSGQFEDLEGPAHTILMDRETPIAPSTDDTGPRSG